MSVVVPFVRPQQKLPAMLFDMVRQGRPAPPKEKVSRGLLRVEVYEGKSSLLGFPRYDIQAVECIDRFVALVVPGLTIEQVRNQLEERREAATARDLTFKVRNSTPIENLRFGIQANEVDFDSFDPQPPFLPAA